MMITKLILILILLTLLPRQTVFAQAESNQLICYENSDTLRNLTTNAVDAARNSGAEGSELVLLRQSPSCRYQLRVYSIPGETELVRRVTVWDSTTEQTIIDYVRPRNRNTVTVRWFWNTNETEVVIGGYEFGRYLYSDSPRGVYHLWKLATGDSVVLHCLVENGCVTPDFAVFRWDENRNWLWTNGREGILAYERNTGEVVRSFANPPWDSPILYAGTQAYAFSEDGTKVMITFQGASGLNDAMTLWDIERMTATPINIEGYATRRPLWGTSVLNECGATAALSPDNRYLVLGDTTLRVWDMENLQPAYEERLPLYRHEGPDARIRCLRFIDARTVETHSADGIQRWDVENGTLVSP